MEFPLGKLKQMRRHFGKEWDRIDDWPADRQPYTVAWELDEAGERLLNGSGDGPVKRARPRRRAETEAVRRASEVAKSGK